MDSGNSGSLQSSSSGGDDEYDESSSRVESDLPTAASFLDPSISSSPFGAIPRSQASSFDLLSSPSSYHLLMAAGAGFSSGHSYNIHASPLGARLQPNPSVHPEHSRHFEALQPGSQRYEHSSFTGFADIHVDHQSSPGGQNVLAAVGGPIRGRNLPISGQGHHHPPAPPSVSRVPAGDHQMNAVRNPKKRTRASRRAPTTVLTTDTTNFRAMVQEFTGIPEPPFSGSSFSRRLDLFGSGLGLRSGSRHLEAMGTAYPFRPSPQKIQTSSRLAASSSPASSSSLLNTTTIISSVPSTTAANFTLAQNMAHPLLTFQSLVQSQGSMSIPSAFEEAAITAAGNLNAGTEGLSGNHHHGTVRVPNIEERSSGSGNLSQRISSCKLNYSTTTLSEIHPDKGLASIISSSRGEGAVDSWICPSD